MELNRRFFKLLVQMICFMVALFLILSMMYGSVSQDLSLPRASHSTTVPSSREHHSTEDLFRKEQLLEIDTGRSRQSLKVGLATRTAASSNHGNGLMKSREDPVAFDWHDRNGIMGNDKNITHAKVLSTDFRENDLVNDLYGTNAPSDSNGLGFRKLRTKYDIDSLSNNTKTREKLTKIYETNMSHTLQADGAVLPTDLIRSIRRQLKEMRKEFEMGSVRTFNRSELPRNLTLLGKAIFRVVPESFSPDYRSPCFHLPKEDGAGLVCLPNVFLGGFPKCATTDLFKKLIRHPEVVATSKEPHWWTRTRFTRESVLHYLKHQTNLVRQMQETGNRRLITLDASASTIWDSTYSVGKFSSFHKPLRWTHADVLRAVLPDARFLLLLREPTERLYSGYMAFDSDWHGEKSPQDFQRRLVRSLQDFRRCMEKYPLGTCASLVYNLRINVGMYSVFIRDWLKRYPRDQVHILRTEDWAKDPSAELSRIFHFLKIDPLHQDALLNITSSSRENRRKEEDRLLGEMLPESRHLLETFYAPFKEDLAQILHDKKYMWT